MNQDLLVELGIEGILERIIVPQVIKNFTPEVLRYFRRCWEQGQTPDMNPDYASKVSCHLKT